MSINILKSDVSPCLVRYCITVSGTPQTVYVNFIITIKMLLDPANIIGRYYRCLHPIDDRTLTQDDARRAPSLPRWSCLVFVRMVAVKM